MNTFSLRNKFIFVVVIISLLTTLCISGMMVWNMVAETDRQVENYRKTLTGDIEKQLRDQTESAISVIKYVYELQQKGVLTEEQAKKEAAARAAAEAAAMRYHTIRSGDTLSGIARKYHTTVKALCRLNGMTEKTVLRVGKRIRVR